MSEHEDHGATIRIYGIDSTLFHGTVPESEKWADQWFSDHINPEQARAAVPASEPLNDGTGGFRLLSEATSEERKKYPMSEGLLDYFPDALAEVSNVSLRGNQKHNPGQPLHHARGKSSDHANCIMRHLMERGGFDKEGVRHSAQLAWRALALLQEELEAEYELSLPRNATAPGVEL